jgi:hypothetical protein
MAPFPGAQPFIHTKAVRNRAECDAVRRAAAADCGNIWLRKPRFAPPTLYDLPDRHLPAPGRGVGRHGHREAERRRYDR